jgi:hypothetical protein
METQYRNDDIQEFNLQNNYYNKEQIVNSEDYYHYNFQDLDSVERQMHTNFQYEMKKANIKAQAEYSDGVLKSQGEMNEAMNNLKLKIQKEINKSYIQNAESDLKTQTSLIDLKGQHLNKTSEKEIAILKNRLSEITNKKLLKEEENRKEWEDIKDTAKPNWWEVVPLTIPLGIGIFVIFARLIEAGVKAVIQKLSEEFSKDNAQDMDMKEKQILKKIEQLTIELSNKNKELQNKKIQDLGGSFVPFTAPLAYSSKTSQDTRSSESARSSGDAKGPILSMLQENIASHVHNIKNNKSKLTTGEVGSSTVKQRGGGTVEFSR